MMAHEDTTHPKLIGIMLPDPPMQTDNTKKASHSKSPFTTPEQTRVLHEDQQDVVQVGSSAARSLNTCLSNGRECDLLYDN